MTLTTKRDLKDDSERPIGKGTPISLGLAIGGVSMTLVFLGSLGTWIWWASTFAATTNTKLDNLRELMLANQTDYKGIGHDMAEVQSKIKVFEASGTPQVQVLTVKETELERRLSLIEAQGSPVVVGRLSALEQQHSKLREEFEIHRVTETKTRPQGQ